MAKVCSWSLIVAAHSARRPTARTSTSAQLRSSLQRRKPQWRSSGSVTTAEMVFFFEAKWVKYKISLTQPWSHQRNKLQGKSTDIESICCSTGAWSWGDSKYFGSLWSWRGRRGRWCGWFTLNSNSLVVQITHNISDAKTMEVPKHVYK